MYDLIIIGAGPAGLTAGIYALRANLKVLILEKEQIGGMIASTPKIENYPGFTSISGVEFANNLYEQVSNLGADIEVEEVIKIVPGKVKEVITEDNTYKSKAVIIAAGSKFKLLGLDKEKEFIGNGISFCTSCDGAYFKGLDVAVVGGGNTAVTNAIYMSKIAKKVYLICRKDKLSSEEKLIDEIKNIKNVEIIYNSTVKELLGDKELKGIIINESGKERTLDINGMFVSIGMNSGLEFDADFLKLTNNKYVDSNDCTTGEDGIFVAGDCRNKDIRQLTTAVSDGTIAAMHVINYLK